MTILTWYLIIAISLSVTSYIQLYKPSIQLLEEILEQKTVYSGFLAKVFWITMGTLVAPIFIYVFLKNDNRDWIETFAVGLAEKMMEDNDEE